MGKHEWPETFLPKLKKKYRRDYLLRLGRFKDAFFAYFPHLCDEELAYEMEWLHSYVILNPIETVRRTADLAGLDRRKTPAKMRRYSAVS
jgi:hypothetical protein